MKRLLISVSILFACICTFAWGYHFGRISVITPKLYEHKLWNGKTVLIDTESILPYCPPEHVLTLNAHTGETVFKTVEQSAKDVWIKGREHTVMFCPEPGKWYKNPQSK